MATFKVTSPDGKTYNVNAPDGATEDDAIKYVQNNFYEKTEPKKIGREGFSDALKSVVSEQNPLTAAIAQGGNTAMQYIRGMRQLTGFGDTKEGKNQDALKDEINKQFPVAGPVGDIGAQIGLTYLGAKALPTGLLTSKVPALANPYAANAATGAALGGLKYGDIEQRATDAALGAAGGVAGTFAGRAIPAVYGGIKGIVEPFTQKGQENIVGRTLRNFSVNPSRVEQAAGYTSRVPGVNPTLAEAALDPGISNLQRQFAVGTADQQLANNAARINAMRSAGGTESAIKSAENVRSGAADALYGQAYKSDAMRHSLASDIADATKPFSGAAGLKVGEELSTPGLRELAGRPAFQSAIKEAQTLARNMGEDIGDPLTSVKGLHYIKLALDEGFKNPQSSLAAFGQRALTNTKSSFLNELETISPLYGNARKTFAELSKPINSMQIGNEILRKSSSAAEDALGNPTLRNEALSRVMRDGDQVARNVTKFNKATLKDSLDPVAYQTIADVRKDLARKAASENLGRAQGSPTAQNLAAQNFMRQIAGPLGAPSGFAEANIWPTLLRPVSWAMKAQDPKIEQTLIKALSDPKFASELVKRKQTQKAIGSLLGPIENYAIPGISGGLLSERQ